MDPMQQNLRSQPVEHNYCEMSGLWLDQKYFPFFQSDLQEVMQEKKPNCSVRFSVEEGMIFSGPPQEISEAYNMAMDFICKCLQIDEVQLLRTTTTTNDYYHELRVTNYDEHELRLRRNTITTKYDYDDSSRGLASIGFLLTLLLIRNSITTNYELRRPRTTITTKYDYDEIRLRRLQ